MALPDDDVFVAERVVVVNGQALDEPGARCPRATRFLRMGGSCAAMNDDFVLGDNQPESSDSHETWLGFITAQNLVGRAWLAYRRRRPSAHDSREIAQCWNLRGHEWPFPWRMEVLAGGKRGTAHVDSASRPRSREPL